MEENKKVIAAIFQNFVKEESGNRVTQNNMGHLLMLTFQAVDGQIKLQAPEDEEKTE